MNPTSPAATLWRAAGKALAIKGPMRQEVRDMWGELP